MQAVVGTVERGAVRLDQAPDWAEGQRVLVIALPVDELMEAVAPPLDLLEEDARELAPRADLLERASRSELV